MTFPFLDLFLPLVTLTLLFAAMTWSTASAANQICKFIFAAFTVWAFLVTAAHFGVVVSTK